MFGDPHYNNEFSAKKVNMYTCMHVYYYAFLQA